MPAKLPPSPEKSLIKGQYHKRMQSFQNPTHSREFASYLERKSPDRNFRLDRNGGSDNEGEKSPSPNRYSTPSPTAVEKTARPSSRYLSKPIFGENTPPSATMLALQNMQVPLDFELPASVLKDSTNSSKPQSPQQQPLPLPQPLLQQQPPQEVDSLSSQIISLTGIATALQHEMSQLSRRSKDNATDLVSLKAATNARDEDIRKSLRDLATTLSSKFLDPDVSTPKSSPFPHHATGSYFSEHPHDNSSPSARKSYSLPRIPSPNTFAASLERELSATPGSISTDGAASIALLEKVLREMATKEGQEKLLKLVEDVKSRPAEKGADTAMSNMLEEILDLVREDSGSRALVRAHQGPDGPLGCGNSSEPDRQDIAKAPPNEEVMSILNRVKQSVAEGGGLTNEVKALVRELRGEVLGMGREIARKLEEAEDNRPRDDDTPRGPQKEEIEQIVQDGLHHLRQQLEHVIEESRQEPPPPPPTLTNDDVYAVVKHALHEVPPPEAPAPQIVGSGLEKDEILEAVREAWETYKPEIELQNFGLERDEILECLSEGLKEYQPKKDESTEPPASYEQVLDAISNALHNWTPPQVEPDMATMREAVMAAVQDCLESFEWPAPPSIPEGATRDDILNAVREGLDSQDRAPPVELDFSREDVYEAVRAGFVEGAGNLDDHFGEQVIEQFHGLASEIKDGFKEYSAANGRDTEQVLDAMKDGLEVLRNEIESYVDRAHDVTGKDEIIDTVKDGFGLLHADVEKCIAAAAHDQNPETVDLLDAMEKEFEHLRQTLSSLLIQNSATSDKDEIIDVIRDLAVGDKFKDDGNSELEKVVKDEFEHLRETLTMTIMKPGESTDKDEIIAALREGFDSMIDDYNHRKDSGESELSNTSELLDVFHGGVDALRADMEKILNKPADVGSSEELLESLKEGLSDIKAEIERLRESNREPEEQYSTRGRELTLSGEQDLGSDIESLKVLVTQLQIKVEAIDIQPPVPEADPDVVKKQDLLEVLESIKEVQGVVGEVLMRDLPTPELPEGLARKEDTDAIETIVQNTKAQLDDYMVAEQEGKITSERIEALETLAKETKDLFEGFTAHVDSEGPTKADVTNVENIIKDVWVAVDDLKTSMTSDESTPDKVVREDVKNLEALLFEIKAQLEEFVLPDPEKFPTKDDVTAIGALVNDFREKIEMENELTAQAFEARKVEHGGLAEKIEDAKGFITEVRDELKGRFGDTDESLIDVKTMIDVLNESTASFAKAETIKELSELVAREFERYHGDREAAKMETEERDLGMMVKHEEGRAAAVSDVVAKLEERFGEVLAKYEEAQMLLETKFDGVEERDKEGLEALTSTKTLAEDIKLVIGGMGNSVTEACDRMGDDARTFFERVDSNFTKVDDMHGDVKEHHEHVKDQFSKTLEATGRLETQMAGAHPEILDAIKELVATVGQHFDHSQRTAEEFKNDLSAIPSAIPPLLPAPPEPTLPMLPDIPDKYDDSQVLEKLSTLIEYAGKQDNYDDSHVREKLAALMEAVMSTEKYDDTEIRDKLDFMLEKVQSGEKYDDTPVHGKLDTLLEHATTTKESLSQMEKLELIQEQVAATAKEVSEMMAAQSNSQESKRKEAEEVAVTLERRLAQREKVEGEIVSLHDERGELADAIKALRTEREELARQNSEMSKELARTETALRIRREEVEMMEERAERIERRIVEDVLDHARAMAISKPNGGPDQVPKRVPSTASTMTRGSTTSVAREGGSLSSSVNMALKRQAKPRSNNKSTVPKHSGTGRRILSHSHVTGNKKPIDRQMSSAVGSGAFGNLRRSQSVKSNYGLLRKTSWEPASFLANKENAVVKEEEEDEEAARENGSVDGDVAPSSDAGTERRTSYTGTFDSMSYVTGSEMSARSVSSDRRISYGSTGGFVSTAPPSMAGETTDAGEETDDDLRSEVMSTLDDHDLDDKSDEEHESDHTETQEDTIFDSSGDGDMVLYGPHSDSGLGSELTTPSAKGTSTVA